LVSIIFNFESLNIFLNEFHIKLFLFFLKIGDFKLTIQPGDFTDSEIIVMLGQNGTG